MKFTSQNDNYIKFMQLPTQEQFVRDCMDKYFFTEIPSDQKWEEAHFPTPECLGGEDTVMLWSADHTVQGLLQSVELDHKCFYHSANGKDLCNLETYYPEYLQLFAQLKSQFGSRQGEKAAAISKANSAGIFAPGMQSANGKIGGTRSAELKVGIFGRSAEQMTVDGRKSAAINKVNGSNAFFNPELRLVITKKGAAVQHAQQWQSTHTDFEQYVSTPCGLSAWQRKRGIDTSLRVRRLDLEGKT